MTFDFFDKFIEEQNPVSPSATSIQPIKAAPKPKDPIPPQPEPKKPSAKINPPPKDPPTTMPSLKSAELPPEENEGGGLEVKVHDPVKQINKAYRLKKIFGKLNMIYDILQDFSDPKFKESKAAVSDAISIFKKVLIPNLNVYGGDIDKIITDYENLISKVTVNLSKKYNSSEEKK